MGRTKLGSAGMNNIVSVCRNYTIYVQHQEAQNEKAFYEMNGIKGH